MMAEERRDICFLHLHWDLHHTIFSYLSPEDLGRLQCVCKYLKNAISPCNKLWKQHCVKVWLVKKLEPTCSTWHAQWYKMVASYGHYRDCYAQVREAWNTIESHLIAHKVISDGDASFLQKRSEMEISSAETKLGLLFPNDFRCSLRMHDGFSCFLGVIEFYYFKSILSLHSLKQMLRFYRESTPDSFYHSGSSQYLPVGSGWPGRETAASVQLLSLPNCQFTPPGHIVTASVVRWIDVPVFSGQELNSGGIIDDCSVGLIGKSLPFKDWLTKEAGLLRFHPVVTSPKGDVSIIRYYCDPSVVETTGHFTIRVGTALDPSSGLLYQSQNSESIPILPINVVPLLANGGSYAYWIEIMMHWDAPLDDMCQLVSRHWVIRYSSGGVESVDGDGIIGQTPVFTAGHVHRYASCTRFNDEDYCTMEGHYTMRYLRRGGEFSIRVPRFHMPKPEITWV